MGRGGAGWGRVGRGGVGRGGAGWGAGGIGDLTALQDFSQIVQQNNNHYPSTN